MTKENSELLEKQTRKVIWHSRRGMLELDVLLLPFSENKYALLTYEEQKIYRRLLEHEDPELFSWFIDQKLAPDAELNQIIKQVLDYAHNRN